MKEKIWILTESYNDYNQHGSYFLAAFLRKPSLEDIQIFLKCEKQLAENIINDLHAPDSSGFSEYSLAKYENQNTLNP